MPEQVDYDGAPSRAYMRERLMPRPEQILGYRQAFIVDNEASSRDGDAIEYPGFDSDTDFDADEMVEIAKGDSHPEAKMEYDGVRVGWKNYGWSFSVHDDDIQDSKLDLIVNREESETRKRMKALDAIAGQILDANHASGTVGTDGNNFDYAAALELQTRLEVAGWSTDEMAYFVHPRTYQQLALSTEFKQATEQFADELRTDGVQHGEILGHPIVKVNSNGPLQPGDAYAVDTSVYGYESPRREFDVDDEYDRDTRETTYYIDGRIGWGSTTPEACVKAVGGKAAD